MGGPASAPCRSSVVAVFLHLLGYPAAICPQDEGILLYGSNSVPRGSRTRSRTERAHADFVVVNQAFFVGKTIPSSTVDVP